MRLDLAITVNRQVAVAAAAAAAAAVVTCTPMLVMVKDMVKVMAETMVLRRMVEVVTTAGTVATVDMPRVVIPTAWVVVQMTGGINHHRMTFRLTTIYCSLVIGLCSVMLKSW